MKEKMTAIIEATIKGAKVRFEDVVKENGQVLHGVIISEGSNISPCIYYNPDKINDDNVEDAVKKIIEIYLEHKDDMSDIETSGFISKYFNRDYVKDNVYPFVLGYNSNEVLIKEQNLVYRELLDLAVLYRLKLSDNASIKISYEHLQIMNISPKDLDIYAFENAKEQATVASLNDTIMELMGVKADDDNNELIPINIYSNNMKYYGAVTAFIDGMITDKCYIIPSSIHETIVLPVYVNGEKADVQELCDIVKLVNITSVSAEEKLSDHVYYYNGTDFEMVA